MTEGSSEEPAPPGALSDATRKASSIGRTEKGGRRKAAARAATKAPRPHSVRASQRDTSPRGRLGTAEPPRRPRGHRRQQARSLVAFGSGQENETQQRTERGGCRHPQPAGPRDNANGQQLPPATPRERPTSHRLCLRKRTAKKEREEKKKKRTTRRTTRASHGDRGPGVGARPAPLTPPRTPTDISRSPTSLALLFLLSLFMARDPSSSALLGAATQLKAARKK